MSTTDLLLLVIPPAVVVVWVLAVCIVRAGTSRQDDSGGYRTSFGRRLTDRDGHS